MKILITLFFTLGLMGMPYAAALSADTPSPQPATATSTPMTTGVVSNVNKAAGKVTIKHGAIKNLDMPPMTMVFRVKEAAMLEQLKEGDTIRFSAERIGGALTVMQFEKIQ
jgi:Cu(I)/Ag(I) efflux system periplasmic protein CusF